MRPTDNLRQTKRPRTRLFRFTEEEEVRIIVAMEAARRFMKKFGKGRLTYMINRNNYL